MGARYGWSEPPDDDNVGHVMMRIINNGNDNSHDYESDRHHCQLGEDQRRVADRHHVDELVLEEQQSAKHNDTAL